eukprot:scaffold72348_cov29-Tisochrysis_lutea.AAC.1
MANERGRNSPTLFGQGNKGTLGRHDERTGRKVSRLWAAHAGTRGGRRSEERGVGETRSKDRARCRPRGRRQGAGRRHALKIERAAWCGSPYPRHRYNSA